MAVKLELKNKIINGGFDFWQRNTSFAAAATGIYSADRFKYQKVGGMVHTIDRQVDVPATSSSIYSLRLDVTTVDSSIAATDFATIGQVIEGNVLRTFKSKKMVLEFWVKSTKTGTFCMSFRNDGLTRSLVKEYTVSASDVWEKKTIRFTHDASGTWDYSTAAGLRVDWALACGTTYQTTADTWQNGNFGATSNQVNSCDNTANNFLLSDVVLVEDNEGQTRDPDFTFAGRDYFEEIQLCQRYFEKSYAIDVVPGTATILNCARTHAMDTSEVNGGTNILIRKRAVPTINIYNTNTGAINTVSEYNRSSANTLVANRTGAAATTPSERTFCVSAASMTANNYIYYHFTADAEL